MARPAVSRADRRIDLVVLALLILGGACYLRSYLGLRSLRAGLAHTPGAQPFAALRLADHYYLYSRVGIALMVVGLLVAVVAAVRSKRRATGPASEQPAPP